MDLQALWEKALKKTDLIRPRLQGLLATSTTRLPYLFLAESSVNTGDTVVRRGSIDVGKPSLILPDHLPQFEGFDFKETLKYSDDTVLNFLLVRGVSFPSLRYNNQVNSLDLHEGRLSNAIRRYEDELQRKEDTVTTLLTGPEDAWQFSILIFIGLQAARSASQDIRGIIDEWKRKGFRS